MVKQAVSFAKDYSTYETPNWSALLQQLLDGQSLSVSQASNLMYGWLTESIPPALSGAILAAIQVKGVSAEELLGMVKVLYSQSVQATLRDRVVGTSPLIDTCGTGGDGASTFNISTSVAFVTAAAGVKVAKHGNRSASGKTGSADVLEALGLNLKASTKKTQEAIDAVGITFLFAPDWHPTLKGYKKPRQNGQAVFRGYWLASWGVDMTACPFCPGSPSGDRTAAKNAKSANNF